MNKSYTEIVSQCKLLDYQEKLNNTRYEVWEDTTCKYITVWLSQNDAELPSTIYKHTKRATVRIE